MKAPLQPFFTLQKLLLGAATILLLCWAPKSYAQEVRTWVDSTGQFKIEAAYDKFENDNVFLKLPDGKLKQIPFSMLSKDDQDRVRNLIAPAKSKETSATPEPSAVPNPSASNPSASAPVSVQEPSSTIPVTPPPTPVAPDSSVPMTTAPTFDTNETSEPNYVNETAGLTPDDLKPPAPIINIGQNIGDLDIRDIETPEKGGHRANPKYLFSVEKSELALLPREFQSAALLLLNEPEKPREAIRALEYLKRQWPKNRQPNLIKLIINCASSNHKFNRETALDILANRDSDQSFPYIFARVDDTSFTIRSMAYQLLRQIGDRRAIEPLARRFASDDVDRIASLLRSFGSASEAPMLPYLTHEDPDIRLRACNLIGKIGTPASLPALQAMAEREQTMMLKAQTRSAINKIKRRSESGSQ